MLPNKFFCSNCKYSHCLNFNALYIPIQTKFLNTRQAESEGLIPKNSDDEKMASLIVQQNLVDKQKMSSYQ